MPSAEEEEYARELLQWAASLDDEPLPFAEWRDREDVKT